MKIKILAAGIALTLPFWACAKDVTIIYTNDLHAHVEPYKVPWIADGKRDIGGWANITTLVKQEKAKNKATWFFDAGDYFTGPYISSLTKGKAIIDIMNTMPFDAVTIGNHEFDHGWDNTLLQLSQAKFPIVQGNIFYQNSSKSFSATDTENCATLRSLRDATQTVDLILRTFTAKRRNFYYQSSIFKAFLDSGLSKT